MSDETLPPGWAMTELGDTCTIHDYRRIPINASERNERIASKSDTELYPYYGATGEVGKIDGFLFDGEYVLIGEDGAPFLEPHRGVSYLVKGKFWVNNHAHILEHPTSNRFLCHYLRQIDYRPFVTGTTRLKLNQAQMRKIPIPLPPLPEQKRIVTKIEELFSELEAGEASLRKARRQLGVYRQSLLKQAFEGKLTQKWRTQNPDKLDSPASLIVRIQAERQARYKQQIREWEATVRAWTSADQQRKRPMRPSEPATFATKANDTLEVPEGWVVEQIGNCPTDALIGLVRSANEQHSGPAGYSYIKMDRVDMLGNTDLRADVFVDCTTDEIARFSLRKGDILFNTRNSVELVGKVGIVRRDPETPTVYNNNLMRLRLPDCLDPVFVGLQLCAHPFRQRMEKVKKATTSVAAVYGKDFWPLPLVLCSLPEQQEIVRLLDSAIEAIERNERELEAALQRSEALRQSILKRAFSGRLVPQDPADEPDNALLARLRAERESDVATKAFPAKKKAVRTTGTPA